MVKKTAKEMLEIAIEMRKKSYAPPAYESFLSPPVGWSAKRLPLLSSCHILPHNKKCDNIQNLNSWYTSLKH